MNEQIFYFFNSFAGQSWFFDKLVVFFADQLPFLLLGGLLVFLWMHEDKKKGARDLAVVVTAALVAWGLAHLIKYLYPHERPTMLSATHALLPANDSSFPSGHATFFSALAVTLYFYHKQIAFWYAVGALLIGLTRIVAGIHWPFDILAGYVLGGLIGVSVYWVYQTKILSKF
jgi:undecaprenyl-diphosphatase